MAASSSERTTPLAAALLERPLSARSVMASLLLGRQPPQASARDLVRWSALFGISEGTARVALHRMVAKGELEKVGERYRVAGRLEQRRREQDRSLRPKTERWDGRWAMAVAHADPRAARDRARRRDALARAHFVELREGLWTRPANSERPPVSGVDWWYATPDTADRGLAIRLFRLERWQRRSLELQTELRRATSALSDGEEGLVATAFVAGAAALRHIRSDPGLPVELLPRDWPADALRRDYATFQDAFTRAARAWFRRG